MEQHRAYHPLTVSLPDVAEGGPGFPSDPAATLSASGGQAVSGDGGVITSADASPSVSVPSTDTGEKRQASKHADVQDTKKVVSKMTRSLWYQNGEARRKWHPRPNGAVQRIVPWLLEV